MSKSFYKLSDSNAGTLLPANKHWLSKYNFFERFLGARAGLCYGNKVYPLPEFTLPLSAPSIQGILLGTTFLIT